MKAAVRDQHCLGNSGTVGELVFRVHREVEELDEGRGPNVQVNVQSTSTDY